MPQRIITICFLLASLAQTNAQIVVRDSIDGSPVIQASVFDEHGFVLGATDMEGRLPELNGAQNISISHISYQTKNMDVVGMGNQVLLVPLAYDIKEVVKEREKPYCLKLKCYYRHYRVNENSKFGKELGTDVPPILSFEEGLYTMFFFDAGSVNNSTGYSQVSVDMNGNVIKNHSVLLDGWSISARPDVLRHSKYYDLRGDSCLKEIWRLEKKETFMVGLMRIDTLNKTINISYDELAKNGKMSFNVGVAKGLWTVWKKNYVYRLTPYPKVGQSALLGYSEVVKNQGSAAILSPNVTYDAWEYKEFFPYDAEYLNKKEYKEAKETAKNMTLPISDISQIRKKIRVPSLSPEIERKIVETRNWAESHRTQK